MNESVVRVLRGIGNCTVVYQLKHNRKEEGNAAMKKKVIPGSADFAGKVYQQK